MEAWVADTREQADRAHPGAGKGFWTSPWLWGGLLALGALARLRQYLGNASYWYDEGLLLVNIFDRSYLDLLGPLEHACVIPPLFLWLLRGLYELLGGGELAMRLPALVFGLAALLLMIPLGRRAVGQPGSLWAFGLCALSIHGIQHSVEVRPYTADQLVAELVLLLAMVCGTGGSSRRQERWAAAGLGVLALLGPWLSFPSVFVLGAASLALLLRAWQVRTPEAWGIWIGVSVLVAVSALGLWYFSARHLYYSGLREHWSRGFPDLGAGPAVLGWLGQQLLLTAHYVARDVNIPVTLLAAVGVVVLVRRSPGLAVLVAGPLALGFAAAFLRRYPMDDRTVFFAGPSIWLLTGAGLGQVLRLMPARQARLGVALAGLLLMPGLLETCKSLAWTSARTEFREGFEYAHEHWAPGDRIWVSHPAVYETYFGAPRELLPVDPSRDDIRRGLKAGRVWLVWARRAHPSPHEAPDCLVPWIEQEGGVLLTRRSLRGLEMALYGAPEGRGDQASAARPGE